MRHFLTGLLAGLLLAGCATTNLPPLDAGNYRPPADEKRLWLHAAEEGKDLDESGLLFHDAQLEKYLNEVMQKLLTDEIRSRLKVQVKVLNNPYSNAFAFPNGQVYVHTGMLARIDNEAQLATLFAHEITHATHRHSARERRSYRNKAAVMASMRATFGTLPAVGELTNALGELGAKAAVSGYSKDLEREADEVGLQRMIVAGYDPREAPKLFDHLLAEIAEEGEEEPFFFGSHPKLKNRKANFEKAVERIAVPRGRTGQEAFESKVAPAILATAETDLKAGRFARAESSAKRYTEIRPKDGRGYYMLGEIHRQRSQEGDEEEAKKLFRQALQVNEDLPDPYRAVGILYFNEGNKPRAKANFNAYLKRAPRADDRDFILEYIRQCQ